MLGITPSSLRDDGLLEITAARYPACKHALAFTGSPGVETSFQDLIGNFDLSINDSSPVIFADSQFGDYTGLSAALDTAGGPVVAMVSGKTRLIFHYARTGTTGTPGLLNITASGAAPAAAVAGYRRTAAGAWTVANGANGGGGGGTGVSAAITGTANDGAKAILDILSITINDASGLQLASFDGTTMTNPTAVALNVTVITGIPAVTPTGGIFAVGTQPGFFAVMDIPVKPTARELKYYCAWMYDALRNHSDTSKTNNGKVFPPELMIYS